MNNISWEWIAGFFEGEGNINWQEGIKGTKHGMSGRIIIGQKDKHPLDAINVFLKKEGFAHILLYQRQGKFPIWILGINHRKDVIPFLKAIEPFLFQKKERANYVINRLEQLNLQREQTLEKALKMRTQKKTWVEITSECHITWTTLNNYAKAKGIELRRNRSDQKAAKKWRRAKLKLK